MLSEAETYLDRLKDRRAQVLRVLDGLDASALDWKPLDAQVNSLAVLSVHCLGSERHWVHEIIGGRKIERDREAEFRARAIEVASLQAMYAAAALESEHVLSQLTTSDMDALRGNPPHTHTVRWCLLHVVEHYSEHVAQMWLTRQLWENKNVRPHEI